jgi:hypothetical protein
MLFKTSSATSKTIPCLQPIFLKRCVLVPNSFLEIDRRGAETLKREEIIWIGLSQNGAFRGKGLKPLVPKSLWYKGI